MNKKELKRLAETIAEAEFVIQTSSDQKEKSLAINQIIALSNKISSLEEVDALDSLVQEKLKKKMNSLT